MLADAFADDPVWAWCLPEEPRRARLLPWIFARIVALQAGFDTVQATDDRLAVSIWVPPGLPEPSRTDLWRSGMAFLSLRLRSDELERLLAYQRASQDLVRGALPGRAWFLSGLGVEPSAQRHGRGRRLVEWGVSRAAADGLPSQLLTSNPDNIGFYERLGFRAVVDLEVPPGGPRTWAMWRG